MDIKNLIQNNKGTIVDVRSRAEFNGGNVANSINIPLQELNEHINKLNELEKPLLLCCASGNRSGMASQILSSQGIECHNAGGWMDVNYIKSL
jgi:rhodanese-related sulfurtransferase